MRIEEITDDFLRTVDVHDILPQREPFVMVGRIVRFEMGASVSETMVREDNLFVEDGFFSPCGIIENIAQTCASRIGIYNKYVLGNDVQIGYIGAIRDCSFAGKVPAGSLLTTRIDVLEEIFGMTLAAASVECDGGIVATANLKLAVKGGEFKPQQPVGCEDLNKEHNEAIRLLRQPQGKTDEMDKDIILSAEKAFEIRFSEVDMMGVVWHGSYAAYLEDAREAFGEKYGLSYARYITEYVFTPIVELKLRYVKPLRYGMKPIVRITYRPTDAAKIVFDYEIIDGMDGSAVLTATSVQVFMDRNYNLLWDSPVFYEEWKKQMGLV